MLSNPLREKIFTAEMVKFFQGRGRDYPWRRTHDPYKILIAELMLQRTRAEQVLTVYKKFINEFPDPDSLSMASSHEIRNLLEPLGLRWRARKVEALAKTLRKQGKLVLSTRREDLVMLPGVGDYAADAILCYAHGNNVVPVDTNVCRVLGRVFGLRSESEARRDRSFLDKARNLPVPDDQVRDFNWGLIDFAASTCTSRKPACPSCSINSICLYTMKTIK